jgi:hypothetical protein
VPGMTAALDIIIIILSRLDWYERLKKDQFHPLGLFLTRTGKHQKINFWSLRTEKNGIFAN